VAKISKPETSSQKTEETSVNTPENDVSVSSDEASLTVEKTEVASEKDDEILALRYTIDDLAKVIVEKDEEIKNLKDELNLRVLEVKEAKEEADQATKALKKELERQVPAPVVVDPMHKIDTSKPELKDGEVIRGPSIY